MSEPRRQTKVKVGRKEELTLDLARKIVTMIHHFPDAGIEVTWNNVIQQVKQRHGHKFHRNTLSQKEWGGEKLIADAFKDAEDVQQRLLKERAPKYADAPNSRLRLIIAKLQAEKLAQMERQEKTRAQQYDELRSLLDIRTPLHRVVELRAERSSAKDYGAAPKPNSETVVVMAGSKSDRAPNE